VVFYVVNNGGSIDLLAGGGSDSTSLTVGVDTSAAGARTGTVTLNYQTDGTGTSGLGTLDVGSQTIAVSGNVFQVAEGNLNVASYNFGTVQVGQTVNQALSISNIATGPVGFVEDLNARFGGTSGQGAGQISGSGSITGLAAGGTDASSMMVSVNTASAGTINGAIAVNYFSAGTVNGVSNGLGELAVGSQNFGVNGLIEATATVIDAANPVINTVQPINLGNVRQGATSPTAFVSVTNQATGNDQAALNATISGNAPITASGGFNLLDPGQTNASSLQVGLNTATAGAVNGTATLNLVSDASNIGNCAPNCEMTLASQNVQVTGAVYRLANPEIDTPTIILAARVGDAAPTANVGVANVSPDAFTEGLDATIGGTTGPFSTSGAINNLAAGGSDAASLQVALDTSTAGSFNDNATVAFVSTGAGTTGAADLSVGSGDVALTGRVYTSADPVVATNIIDFGIVHVGDFAEQALQVLNNADLTGLNDTLAASLLDASGPFSASGSFAGLGAQQSDSASLVAGLDTSNAGVFNGNATVKLASQNPDLADLVFDDVSVSLLGTVNNYANPLFALNSGLGALSMSGLDFTIDLGSLFNDFGSVNTGLSFSNAVAGPADLLRGSYDLTGVSTPFTLSGFGDFDNLVAGDTISGLSFAFNTADLGLGSFQETITLTAFGFNASGFQQQFDINLNFRGLIQDRDATSVDEPPMLLLMLFGLAGLYGRLRLRRVN